MTKCYDIDSPWVLDSIEKVHSLCEHFGGTRLLGQGLIETWNFPSWGQCKNCGIIFRALNGEQTVIEETVDRQQTIQIRYFAEAE